MLHHENFSETEALKMCHILLMGSCYVGVGEVVLQPVFNAAPVLALDPKAGAKDSVCDMFGNS